MRTRGSEKKARATKQEMTANRAPGREAEPAAGGSAGLQRNEWRLHELGKSFAEIPGQRWRQPLTLSPLQLGPQHVEESAFGV